MLRYLTAGESHGPALTTIVEGAPAHLPFTIDGLGEELKRRRSGHGRGNRMKIEKDVVEIVGGVRHGETLGSPVAVLIRNTEWSRWSEDMSAEPGEPQRTLTAPRPGHADLSGMLKYNTYDARDILERSSARETAARTVAGYVAKQLLGTIGVSVLSHVIQIGSVEAQTERVPSPRDLSAVDGNPVRCFDQAASEAMVQEIDKAKRDRDTLGGVVEVLVYGLPAGVGSHVHFDRKLDARLAEAMMSIQSVKAVEVGDGTQTAKRRGSSAHDEIYYNDGFERKTDRAGGTEGGMTTGQPLRVRAYLKPISTLMRALDTVDVRTKEPEAALRERSDVCAVPAGGVVAEQVVAVAVAQELQRMLGGDTVEDFQASMERYVQRIEQY
jgi:chorismate synthase